MMEAREQLESEHIQQIQHDKAAAVYLEDCDIKSRHSRVAKLENDLCIVVDAKENALESWNVREHLKKETMRLLNLQFG